MIENDLVEAIIALPEKMFYNTAIGTYIWIISNKKEVRRKGKIQLIDATAMKQLLKKNLGLKNSEIAAEFRDSIVRIYMDMEESEVSRIFENNEFGVWKITVLHPKIDENGKMQTDARGNLILDRGKPESEIVPFNYKGGVDAFLRNEVFPYAPHAQIDKKKIQIGYEINFMKYFYQKVQLRSMNEIIADLETLEQNAEGLMQDIIRECRQ